MVSMGIVHNSQHKESYFGNAWNYLDFLVVVTSAIDIFTGGGDSGLKSLKSLRALRALRPLRVISRNEGLKIIVEALFRILNPLKNLIIIAGVFVVVVANISTSLFKGKFYSCEGLSEVELESIITK
eukprot:CAMPEP_0114575116 /NCGR_PEP_ID=MMETSP0125-20121206/25_1 /TAXON_ID=485358 ORGANISM="Aristerostoma sp., Strain ATCC 50986" /NCGR_SAMPLE_ID=MMETSP0125 /ASSEMBLY_ACC=CAM_ASM_000245 /LENGTH=126 /DNA_ID=CAMNT_0001762603 /DNA_START=769 /DNA_END=1149 /DNA_ORIENTATION=+